MTTQSLTTSQDIYGDHVPRDIDEWYADLATDVWDAQKRMWKIAHKLAWGEATYEDEIYQYLDGLPFSAGYLANLKTLGGNFPPSRRRELERKGFPEFPLSYYQELCSLTPPEQERILHAVVEDGLKRDDIRKLKRQIGVHTPRSTWEIACENDALANENSGLRSQNGKLTADLATARAHMAAIEAEAAVQCEADPGTAAREAYERDRETEEAEAEARRVVCPECGAIIEVIL
jgi:hypothetical protein